jgi:hypothetical protein
MVVTVCNMENYGRSTFFRDQTRREVKGGGEQEAEPRDSVIILKCYPWGTLGDGSTEGRKTKRWRLWRVERTISKCRIMEKISGELQQKCHWRHGRISEKRKRDQNS